MSYRDIITIEPGKRSGKPCIRGMRITVYDILEYLAAPNDTTRNSRRFPLSHTRGYSSLSQLCG